MSVSVKIGDIIEAIELQYPGSYQFLNMKNGKVVIIDSEAMRAAEDDEPYMDDEALEVAIDVLENEDNYIELPEEEDINEYDIMEDFCLSLEDAHQKEKLLSAIKGKGAFRRFKDKIIELGVRDEWFTYRDERIKQFVIEWCEAHQIDYKK
ncbi:hypothetical protein JNUCC1_02809 [Lentibacillus sp. JNUCC-1]|uniref:UPF0158 family protein n=1 Tax=Lentibacillus sp. JNUCC-1 TaxID=2654513 RepID=UPI0012E7E0B6|nr:UPF0158 family protein [Lentibacillus sp. JNUCC-1]MUV38937.1 hypothetical protein [Lentibacillus sp. JNUCC-1]